MENRGQWGSRTGFILAAAGSAVGLGNIWKFPYITGANGGGIFVLAYLGCVLFVGLPVMIAEVLLGRATQKSPVGAMRILAGRNSLWTGFGWLGITSSFVILSYYSIVAGWALDYTFHSLGGKFTGVGAEDVQAVFGQLYVSPLRNLFWHAIFMGLAIAVVLGGVARGVERWSRILMPTLLVMLLVLLVRSFTLSGFNEGVDFIFGFHTERFTASGVLEALGQAFFTLSLGMGAMLTYGSYLRQEDDIVVAAITISSLDTLVAIVASLVLFPIIFSFGMEPGAGPGLVFISIPIALSQMPGGSFLGPLFFGLLVFAALTSAISMLEVTTSYFIDEKKWMRRRATLVSGGMIALLGIPSALSGGTKMFGSGFASVFGMNWFDSFDYLASNWMLPLGGLGISVFTAWRMDEALRRGQFLPGSKTVVFYKSWLLLLKFAVPIGILLVFLNAVGLI